MASICLRQGRVVSVDETLDDLTVVTVSLAVPVESGETRIDSLKACVYKGITPTPTPGDLVVVNTLGVELGLGTGGYGFVLINLSKRLPDLSQDVHSGHIVKLRYTPLQTCVLSVEEELSPYHSKLRDERLSLEGKPVVCAELHSALPAIVAGVKAYDPSLSICYVMTDGGALPLAFSKTVRKLKSMSLLQSTVTVGHAFGGDLEAVNVFSGLISARHLANADVIVVAKGPGIVGTGTPLGHTGMEQGEAANAAFRLNGVPILIPRLSEADDRERHSGISHHFVSVLRYCVYCPTIIPVASETPHVYAELEDCLASLQASQQHRLVKAASGPGLDLASRRGIELSTMGRSVSQEPAFFAQAAAGGWFAGRVARLGLDRSALLGACWASPEHLGDSG